MGLWALYASASLACGSVRSPGGPSATGGGGSNANNVDGGTLGTGGGGGVGGAGGNDAGMSGGAAGSAGADTDASTASCAPASEPPQGVVRLAFSQLARSVTTVLGDDALNDFAIPTAQRRYFLPLATEGSAIDSPVLDTTISLVESAVAHNLSQPGAFAAASGCADDDDCIRNFLLSFADRAFRRPLNDDEKASVLQSYSEMRTAGLSPSEAGPYAVEGILISPAVVYRTELGSASGADATLTPYERASQLSYFLSDGPPDGELRQAAATGLLADPVGLRAQVDRYLQIGAVRDNLSAAMFAYYDFDDARIAIKDPNVYPDWTPALLASMETEAQSFLGRVLWEGTVFDQLTSHRSSIDENLARLYGVSYPAAPGSGFVPVDLPPAQRSGVLTMASWLAAKSPAAITSPTLRGTWVNTHIACGPVPPPGPDHSAINQPAATALDMAKLRLSTQPCSSCHQFFDSYGALLENYDAIGRFRTTYSNGDTIAPEITLPSTSGGGVVHDIDELAQQVTSNGVFSACLTASLVQYASSGNRLDPLSCPVQNAHARFWVGDRSFTSLVREVAVSDALAHRAVAP